MAGKADLVEKTTGKGDLVDKTADLTGFPKTRVGLCFDIFFELIADALESDERVTVPGFGSFYVSMRSARDQRNPATGEVMHVAASRSVRFKPAKGLKDQVAATED